MTNLSDDLSQRIMDAWLAVNSSPKWDDPSINEWHRNLEALRLQLHAKAYESAVIQFLVPKGMTYQLGNYLFIEGGVYGQNICCESNSGDPAESLLNATESARLK